MPYNPGVTDISGQLRAQGITSAAGAWSQGMQQFAQSYEQMKKKQEDDKVLLAQAKATESFMKSHAGLFGGEEAVNSALATDPGESPMVRYARTAQMMKQGIAGQEIAKSKAEIEQATQAAVVHRAQAGSLAAELAKRNSTDAVLKDPEVLQFLDDPYKFYAAASAKGADPSELARNPFIMQGLQNRSREEIAAARLEGAREIAELRQQIAANNAAVPTNYRRADSTGRVEPIPGTKEEMEIKALEQKTAADARAEAEKLDMVKRREAMFKADVDETLSNIEKAKGLIKATGITGQAGGAFDSAMATIGLAPKTKNLKSLYNSIRSAQLVNKLNEMRTLSTSGASGAGNLSDKDAAAIASTVAELDASQDEKFQVERLNTLESYLKRVKGGTARGTASKKSEDNLSLPPPTLPSGWSIKG